jgi:hypothetical protein
MRSIMKGSSALTVCVGALVLTASAGCHRVAGTRMVKHEYDPNGRKMLIIPFKCPTFGYFESPEGRVLAEYVGYYVLTQHITPVMYEAFFPQGVKAIYEKHVNDPTAAWKEIADSLGYDLALVGEIGSIDIAVPEKDKAEMIVSARLYDMKHGRKAVWEMNNRRIVFPEGWEYGDDEIVPDFSLSSRRLRNRLLQKAGEVIGKCFHDHMEPVRDQSDDVE